MASNKPIIRTIPQPGIPGHPQANLDWNTRRKPAVTPRREWQLAQPYFAGWAVPTSSPSGPRGGGVIQ